MRLRTQFSYCAVSLLLAGATSGTSMQHELPTRPTDHSQFTSTRQSCVRAAARQWASEREWVVPNTTPPCTLIIEGTDVALVPDGDKVGRIGNVVARDAAGRFYTYERTGTIAVWSPTGAIERTFARGGQGPGELAPGLMSIVPGRNNQLYVLDNGRRWHLFRTNGDFVQTVQSSGLRQSINFAVLDDGRLLDGSGYDAPDHFFTIWSPLGDASNPRPVVKQRIAAIHEREREVPIVYRARHVAYGSGDSFWAGPPRATGRGYQLEQWSTTGARLKSIRRNVSWFPDGADRANLEEGVTAAPPHEIRGVWNLGDDLLLVVTHATNAGVWSEVRGGQIDAATRDRLTSVWAEVIDTRSGLLLAQLGPLTFFEATRMLPSHVFQGSMTGYRFERTPDDDMSVRVVRLRLDAK